MKNFLQENILIPNKISIQIKQKPIELQNKSDNKIYKCKFNNGRWSDDEHKKFLKGIIEYGNKWKKIQNIIITRSSTQARSHAQKFFLKIKNDLKLKKNNLIKDSINENANFSIKYFFELLTDFDKDKSNIQIGKLDKEQKEKLFNLLCQFSSKRKIKKREKNEYNTFVKSNGNKIIIKNIDLNEINENDINDKIDEKIFNVVKDNTKRDHTNINNISKTSDSTFGESNNNNFNLKKRKDDLYNNNIDFYHFNNCLENTNCGNGKDNPFEIKFENLSQNSSIDENEKEENNSIFELNNFLMIEPKKIE